MSPILFLDIDDVVCLNERYGGCDVILAMGDRSQSAHGVLSQVFNRDACELLRRLHESLECSIRYVISSTWREMLTREQFQIAFRVGGLDFVAESLHDAWCTSMELERGSRDADITQWLDLNHRGEPFAVLDDTRSGASLKQALRDPMHELFGRVVLCREGIGLRPGHLEALQIALRQCADERYEP